MSSIDNILNVLQELGLPYELAAVIVYKFGGAQHPAINALRTEQHFGKAVSFISNNINYAGMLAPARDKIVNPLAVCTCKLGRHLDPDKRTNVKHYIQPIYHWKLLRRDAPIWFKNTRASITCDSDAAAYLEQESFICPYTRLIMRMVVCGLDEFFGKARHDELNGYLSNACLEDECPVLGSDNTLSTWIKHAPYEALVAYAQNLSGQSEEEIQTQTDTPCMYRVFQTNMYWTRKKLIRFIMQF